MERRNFNLRSDRSNHYYSDKQIDRRDDYQAYRDHIDRMAADKPSTVPATARILSPVKGELQ